MAVYCEMINPCLEYLWASSATSVWNELHQKLVLEINNEFSAQNWTDLRWADKAQQASIYQLPTYDWTFRLGQAIYSAVD